VQARHSSLREFDKLGDRIRLHRQVDKRPIAIVEGPSDKRFLEDVVEAPITVFIAGTRDDAIEAARDAARLAVTQLVSLVDRDFDDAVALAQQGGVPVIAYDGADIEDMLVRAPSGTRVIEELASDGKLGTYGGVALLMATLEKEVAPVSRLRRGNALNGWGLAFDMVALDRKIDRSTLALNVTGFCAALAQSSSAGVSRGELESTAARGAVPVCTRTGHPLIRGRDLLAAVGVALRKLVGSRTRQQTQGDLLGDMVRAAADKEWVRETAWFSEVRAALG
jgi:hypothetical protein